MATMSETLRERIRKASAPRIDDYPVAVLGTITVTSVNTKQLAPVLQDIADGSPGALNRAFASLAQLTMIDKETLGPALTSEDAKLLLEMDSAVATELWNCLIRHCGIQAGNLPSPEDETYD